VANTISLSEPAVDALMSTWTGIRLERGASSTNLGSFSLVVEIPYVAHQTTYVVTDTSGTASDWYRIARYTPLVVGDYSPPWPVTPGEITAGPGARRSLKSCRRMLGRRLGSLQVTTTTADGLDDGTSLVAAGLANGVDANRYYEWWVMPTDGVSAGLVRQAGKGALNPTTGQLNIQPGFLARIYQGTEVELHKLLPPDESVGTVIGLRECLNLALAECWVPDRSTISWTGGYSYDLAQLGDWLDPAAVNEVYAQAGVGFPLEPYGGFNVVGDAASRTLELVGMATGTQPVIEFTRPADSLIKVGGIWTDGQQGLQNDDDECLLQPTFLVTVALAHAYDALANGTTGKAHDDFQRKADDSRRQANIVKRNLLARLSERPHEGYSRGDDWMSWIR
jgi:hypothetical protein